MLHYETDDAFIEEQYMRRLGCLFAIGMMWLCIVDCFSQGLLFYGNEKRISERATYSVLREGHERTFTNAFRISFDYLVRNVESPGYILYLEDRDAGKTYSFTYLHKPGDRCSFSFNEDGKRIFCTFELDKEDYDHRWLPVSIAWIYPQTVPELRLASGARRSPTWDWSRQDSHRIFILVNANTSWMWLRMPSVTCLLPTVKRS